MNETPIPPTDSNQKSLAEEISEPKGTTDERPGIASGPVEDEKVNGAADSQVEAVHPGAEVATDAVPIEVKLAISRFRKGEYVPLKGVWFEVIGSVSGRLVLYPMGWTAKEMKRWKG